MNLVDKFLIGDEHEHRYVIFWAPAVAEGQEQPELEPFGFAKDYKESVQRMKEASATLPRPCVIECYGFISRGTVTTEGLARFDTCYGTVEEHFPTHGAPS